MTQIAMYTGQKCSTQIIYPQQNTEALYRDEEHFPSSVWLQFTRVVRQTRNICIVDIDTAVVCVCQSRRRNERHHKVYRHASRDTHTHTRIHTRTH